MDQSRSYRYVCSSPLSNSRAFLPSLGVEIEKSSEGGVGVILFINEMNFNMAGSGGESSGMDAANFFKPLLSRRT